ncbi:MAG: hypothetical protein ABIZ91_14605 [Gemmatimonadaceae bacterium]
MTDPTPTPASSPVIAGPPEEPVKFPIGWVLSNAAAPVQYRALTSVAQLDQPPELLPSLVYTHFPALRLAISQQMDGVWNKSMLAAPSPAARNFKGVGTIQAFRRMLEWGWEAESPPLLSGRKIIFRLLAEDNDPNFLFEFASDARVPELRTRGRLILREAAAAALAHAGYENDPRLRGCAQRMLTRVGNFLGSALAADPWMRVGNKHVLSPDASPPSIHLLTMLAHMPHFRSEHRRVLELLFEYLSRPLPRQESKQLVAGKMVRQPHYVLGDPLATRNMADGDIPSALNWLEIVGRLGFLWRNEHWSRLFERFLNERDRYGVWRPGKAGLPAQSESAVPWPIYPLDGRPEADAVSAEITTRLGIIARASGRTIEVI